MHLNILKDGYQQTCLELIYILFHWLFVRWITHPNGRRSGYGKPVSHAGKQTILTRIKG